ncbi:MAG: HPr family phosphocarrier protein [Clostridia bacterium]|nr:HPr family phosphocarrier protein [Clostridia bacterium]
MVQKSFTLKNKMGFHMRPAQVFVGAMAKYPAEIKIEFNGKEIDGKSIMNIMASCMKCGSEITVKCSGENEEAMLAEAAAMIESGFGEE